jgi:CHU_C Type IX secretion signal domain
VASSTLNLVGCADVEQAQLLIDFNCLVTEQIQVAVCAGDVYTFQGSNIAAGQSETFSFISVSGCDSMLTISVTALPVSASLLQVSACAGDSYNYLGTNIAAGQSQNFTLNNYLGCDSVVTVNVGVYPNSAQTLNVQVCPGDSYNYLGTNIAAGQSQNFTLTNYLGCDSVVTVNVGVYPNTAQTLNVQVCAGDSYNYLGTNIAAGQSQNFTLTNYLGCDSVVTVNVGVYPNSASTLQVTVCQGDQYNYQNTWLNAGQSQVFMLTNSTGCDSLVTVQVGTLPTYQFDEQYTICPNTTLAYNGATLQVGEVRTFNFMTVNNCDSVVTVTVLSHPSVSFSVSADTTCYNAPTATLTVVPPASGPTPFEYSLDGTNYQSSLVFDELSADNYTVLLRDANQCIFEQNALVTAYPPLNVELTNGFLPCDSSNITLLPVVLSGRSQLLYRWADGSELPELSVKEPGNYSVQIDDGCSTQTYNSEVVWGDAGDWAQVYVPNVFAPESSSDANAYFRPFVGSGLQVLSYRMSVFDRWGDQLYTTTSMDEGWHGPVGDRMMQSAVFVWYLEVEVAFCGRRTWIKKSGDITVIR